MTSGEMEKVLKLLELMTQLECAISDLYKAVGNRWEEEKEFWVSCSMEEAKHSKNLQEMANILSNRPEVFQMGRPFNLLAVQTALAGVKAGQENLENGGVTLEHAFYKALDIENALLESKYVEIVRTHDIQYQNMLKEILTQTKAHKNRMEKKIMERKKLVQNIKMKSPIFPPKSFNKTIPK